MAMKQNQNQCEKLCQHLNYCLDVLKRSMDTQKLQIFKRLQHDIEILEKYVRFLIKFNQKRQKQIQKLIEQVTKKDQQIQIKNTRILQLSYRIQKKEQQITNKQIQITKKEGIIQHLKYSNKLDASYVSSILINGNQSLLQQKIQTNQIRPKSENQKSIMNGFDLSSYREIVEQQKISKNTLQTKTSDISQKGQQKLSNLNKNTLQYNQIIKQVQELSDQNLSQQFEPMLSQQLNIKIREQLQVNQLHETSLQASLN